MSLGRSDRNPWTLPAPVVHSLSHRHSLLPSFSLSPVSFTLLSPLPNSAVMLVTHLTSDFVSAAPWFMKLSINSSSSCSKFLPLGFQLLFQSLSPDSPQRMHLECALNFPASVSLLLLFVFAFRNTTLGVCLWESCPFIKIH